MILCLPGLGVPARAGAANPAANQGSFGIRLLEAPTNCRGPGPGAETPVLVSIRVPATASAGERDAVVWASMASRPSPPVSVNLINRVGIRVYLDIGPGGEPPSDFTLGEMVPARDKFRQPSLTIAVGNTGGRALDMTGEVNLSGGPAGARVGPFPVSKGTTLAPGEAGKVAVLFPRELPNGPWKVEVNLASGWVKHTATGMVRFPDPDQVGHPARCWPVSAFAGPCWVARWLGWASSSGWYSRSAAPGVKRRPASSANGDTGEISGQDRVVATRISP